MKTKSLDTADKGGQFLVTQPTGAVNAVIPVRPEYIRLPKAGALCAWTGISRSKMNDLILRRPGVPAVVESFNLRKRNQIKGTRLVVLESLMAYLGKCRKEQGEE